MEWGKEKKVGDIESGASGASEAKFGKRGYSSSTGGGGGEKKEKERKKKDRERCREAFV